MKNTKNGLVKESGFSLIHQNKYWRLKQKPNGFSLIEVLFAVLFLVFIGVAMSALNSAAARLITTSEVKVMATSLNEQSLSYVALLKKTQGNQFDTYLTTAGCTTLSPSCTLFVICFNTQTTNDFLTKNCQLSTTDTKTQLGKSRLQFSSVVKFMPQDASNPHLRYLVLATTSWGPGANRNVIAGQMID